MNPVGFSAATRPPGSPPNSRRSTAPSDLRARQSTPPYATGELHNKEHMASGILERPWTASTVTFLKIRSLLHLYRGLFKARGHPTDVWVVPQGQSFCFQRVRSAFPGTPQQSGGAVPTMLLGSHSQLPCISPLHPLTGLLWFCAND